MLALLGCLVGCAPITIAPETPIAGVEPAAIEDQEFELVRAVPAVAVIRGRLEHAIHGMPIADAKVVLSCACLQTPRVGGSDARGTYSFADLPPGTYTIRVLTGRADVSKVTALAAAATVRGDFAIDPEDDEPRFVVVDTDRIPDSPGYRRMLMDAAKRTPVREFTVVVDLGPTSTRCESVGR